MKTTLPFVKYQGAGNDFVIVNHWSGPVLTDLSAASIARLCDRRFGIGADGLMLLERDPDYDFRMVYYNADGHPSTMCGNGGRCMVAFAHRLGLIGAQTTFRAVDGPHRAHLTQPAWVELEMTPVTAVTPLLDGHFLDTGSPHYVAQVARLDAIDVDEQGRTLRQRPEFAPGGTNVNFVTGTADSGLTIATYERGVEAETLACGTGVTAAALVAAQATGRLGDFTIPVSAKGGALAVRLHYDGTQFSQIWLCGPAVFVFAGEVGA